MKKQLLTALSVAVFVIGLGWFGYLINERYNFNVRLPGPSIDEIRDDVKHRSSASSASIVSSTSSSMAPVPPGPGLLGFYTYGYGEGSRMEERLTDAGTNLVVIGATNFRPYNSTTALAFTGSTTPNTAKIVVTYTPPDGGKEDVYTLSKYVPGAEKWSYSYSEKFGNLKYGGNEYVVRSYDAKGALIDELTIVAIHTGFTGATEPPKAPATEPATLDVTWSEPAKVDMLDLVGKSANADRYQHDYRISRIVKKATSCAMGFDGEFLPDAPTKQDTEKNLREESVYAVGTVSSGEYAGSTVYLQRTDAFGWMGCDAGWEGTFHFLRTPNGELVRADAWETTTPLTEPMAWQNVVVDGSGPNTVSIDNSGVKLLECTASFCRTNGLLKDATTAPAPGFSRAETRVYAGEEGCFQVKRNDGALQDYKVDIKMGNIAWLDGKTMNTVYTPDPVTGGCGQQPRHCHYLYEGDPKQLERVGTTEDGLEVYQEIVTPAELVAMSSGSMAYKAGAQTMYELFWSMAKYGENENITPAQFVARHPAVYVKDPLGRLVYFQGEQFGPAVECGKPVIYLYPEKEQDVDVYVAPTGGFTVTDPPYNDGWHVRATPESVIRNYADGKTYPYLFWEGHGAEYTRPTRGFVAAKAEVPALLREKLALLGLADNEIDDFMEFWEPRLTTKPYVFVTFVDQPTFDTIAPLTVEPAPDTVIRVFMDYEPLESPIDVEPLPIITPVRSGFSVVEWGGALHPGDRGMCAAGVLLQ